MLVVMAKSLESWSLDERCVFVAFAVTGVD